ncbi:hypothetical protein EVAR_42036_1 [Eumeta japonica]|uniref:Uncharacterized protein n=1 Tax=Eumeta variegata TaxID=151549 RepID=A0A4C1Y5S2_EUMVA|nr:hypothetical protein EVAR_42036_1 [Eumeta japonica]
MVDLLRWAPVRRTWGSSVLYMQARSYIFVSSRQRPTQDKLKESSAPAEEGETALTSTLAQCGFGATSNGRHRCYDNIRRPTA